MNYECGFKWTNEIIHELLSGSWDVLMDIMIELCIVPSVSNIINLKDSFFAQSLSALLQTRFFLSHGTWNSERFNRKVETPIKTFYNEPGQFNVFKTFTVWRWGILKARKEMKRKSWKILHKLDDGATCSIEMHESLFSLKSSHLLKCCCRIVRRSEGHWFKIPSHFFASNTLRTPSISIAK